MATPKNSSCSDLASDPSPAIDRNFQTTSTPPSRILVVAHESDLDSESDVSSTIIHDHEPFSTFQYRVKEHVLHKIWSDAHEENVSVERLSGGGVSSASLDMTVIGPKLTYTTSYDFLAL
ncbi:dihydroneopterin aldolase [Fonsecaea nubica]|uniref:Dihydroneopterin aldolase n=1 Tax=Fonsecaea nubica TaxID=856822 RepID=A0A178CTJ5_9EURO|nr:dihydroneopterin aldolase [Fonsecaea nubica]OAL32777.1 dihydroneopterin aldolase [Fonsecaea nubica]